MSPSERRELIRKENSKLGLTHQCKLLKISKDDLQEWLELASKTRVSMGGFDNTEHNPMHDNPMHAAMAGGI